MRENCFRQVDAWGSRSACRSRRSGCGINDGFPAGRGPLTLGRRGSFFFSAGNSGRAMGPLCRKPGNFGHIIPRWETNVVSCGGFAATIEHPPERVKRFFSATRLGFPIRWSEAEPPFWMGKFIYRYLEAENTVPALSKLDEKRHQRARPYVARIDAVRGLAGDQRKRLFAISFSGWAGRRAPIHLFQGGSVAARGSG